MILRRLSFFTRAQLDAIFRDTLYYRNRVLNHEKIMNNLSSIPSVPPDMQKTQQCDDDLGAPLSYE